MAEQIMTDRERTALQLSRAREALEKVWPTIEKEDFMTETTESKHAKGPWRWSRTYEMGVERRYWCLENDESAAEGKTIDASLVLQHGRDDWLGKPFLDNPNARLIAAAPDLLQACKRALRLVEDEDNNKLIVEMPGSFGLLLDLQNAIEKATGEKP